MKKSDFYYDLPDEQIAQFPLADRTASRLLVVDADQAQISDQHFVDVGEFLREGDLLVLNDTRVIPARLFGNKPSGGKVEVFLERIVDQFVALCQVKSSKGLVEGGSVNFADSAMAKCSGREQGFYLLEFSVPVLELLQSQGQIPLPPYISRTANQEDTERYQTVYADRPGAVAAPTAGLHFDQALLKKLAGQGVSSCRVTLHVGAGTFQPLRVDDLEQHKMHAEWLEVNAAAAEQINQTRAQGGRVVAVGTTSVRCLETSANEKGQAQAFCGETRLFIKPGYSFKCTDALITNFHLPESTLMMLVCALGGYDHMMSAYRHAVMQGYRFFSYGDAMLVLPKARDLT